MPLTIFQHASSLRNMKLSLRTSVIFIPLLLAIVFASIRQWYAYNYAIEHAEVEYLVSSDEADLKSWLDDWRPYLQQCDYVAGCGCCTATYEIRGPRRAIQTFPVADYAPIEWSPKQKIANSAFRRSTPFRTVEQTSFFPKLKSAGP